MKRTFLLLPGMLALLSVSAQTKQGTITYEKKVNMYRTITDEQMRAMIPEYRTNKFTLQFSDSSSIYHVVAEDEAPDPFAGGGGGARVFFRTSGAGGDNSILYKNFATGKSIEATDLGAKTYLIEDSIRTHQWKLTDETKAILGHPCRKAVTVQTVTVPKGMKMVTMSVNGGKATSDTTTKAADGPQTKQVEVVAWYADDIASPVGPDNNGGLPGVILQLDVNNAETVYTATNISKDINGKEMKEPTKGKKVTRTEFRKLQADAFGGQGMMKTVHIGM